MNHTSRRIVIGILLAFCTFGFVSPLWAHFQVILPSNNIVSQGGDTNLELKVLFTHPFEQQLMDMERPRQFGVVIRSEKINLLDSLRANTSKEGLKSWETTYKIKRPGIMFSL